jgi:hypothetical protein
VSFGSLKLLLLLCGCAELFLLPLLVVGECAKAMWMSDPTESETSTESPEIIRMEPKVVKEEQPQIITCAICKGDFLAYKGEVSCCQLLCKLFGDSLYLFTCSCSPITDSNTWREYLPFSLSPPGNS